MVHGGMEGEQDGEREDGLTPGEGWRDGCFEDKAFGTGEVVMVTTNEHRHFTKN